VCNKSQTDTLIARVQTVAPAEMATAEKENGGDPIQDIIS